MPKQLDYVSLGARIRQTRKKLFMTQEQLGEACGLSTAHIGHIERGTRALSVDSLFVISTVLQTSVDYLLFDSFDTDESLFLHINAMLKGKEKSNVKNFITTVRALADKIDEL